LDQVTIVINKLPESTPLDDDLYLAPDFNGWDPGDSNMIFDKFSDGRLFITIPASGRGMEYKITRGNWSTVEVTEYGESIADRTLAFGFADTVYIEVVKWRDFDGNY